MNQIFELSGLVFRIGDPRGISLCRLRFCHALPSIGYRARQRVSLCAQAYRACLLSSSLNDSSSVQDPLRGSGPDSPWIKNLLGGEVRLQTPPEGSENPACVGVWGPQGWESLPGREWGGESG